MGVVAVAAPGAPSDPDSRERRKVRRGEMRANCGKTSPQSVATATEAAASQVADATDDAQDPLQQRASEPASRVPDSRC